MVGSMVGRHGHSLAEVLVSLTILSGSLAALSATAAVSTRRTREAVRLQEATALATALLDSLVADPDPRSGGRATPRGWADWEVAGPEGPAAPMEPAEGADDADDADGAQGGAGRNRLVRVRVRAEPAGPPLAELRAAWIPHPPGAPGLAP